MNDDPAVGGDVPQDELYNLIFFHGGIIPCVSMIF
jgi:hypothetical protein